MVFFANMPSFYQSRRELLMVGMSSKTYRIGNKVRKECHVLTDDAGITAQNLDACNTEANVYLILGAHPLIATCLSASPSEGYVELEFYPNGTLKSYMKRNRPNIKRSEFERWAVQMIESIVYVHSKGVRHSDLRLDQWLVDEARNARLGDFNASGYDAQSSLGLKRRVACGLESTGYYLPRSSDADSSVVSDLFALGSSLYELNTDRHPYQGLDDDMVEGLFAKGDFPSTEGLLFGAEISACWNQKFTSARDLLDAAKTSLKGTRT